MALDPVVLALSAAGEATAHRVAAALGAQVHGRKGRVAKARVMHFLRAEAKADKEAAAFVGELLGRQSATAAVMDRAGHIEALLDIHTLYPDVQVPITIKPIEVR